MACESQVAGGVIMGVNYALYEERIMDDTHRPSVNADMEFYKLGGILDMRTSLCICTTCRSAASNRYRRAADRLDAAAVGNAVFNAIRPARAAGPVTPERVLAALGNPK